jgi:hypothetical protein
MGSAIKDYDMFHKYHSNKANQGTLWALGANNGAPEAMPAPNLLAIPNALISLLRTQGPLITLNEVHQLWTCPLNAALTPPHPTVGMCPAMVYCGGTSRQKWEKQGVP